MKLAFDPDVFALGVAVGVLGLVLLLSLVVSYAYDESTLLFLAGYLAVTVVLLAVSQRLQPGSHWQILLLVFGPAVISGFQMWLFKKRATNAFDRGFIVLMVGGTLSFLAFLMFSVYKPLSLGRLTDWTVLLSLAWGFLMGAGFVYRGLQSLETAGPWKWWLMLGHAAGLLVALLFLADVVDARQAYWPVVLMLLVQVPPIYLSLVWRSRLLNEARLRSAAAGVVDPLTGLATPPVLIERLMRIMARSAQARTDQTSSALYLVEVQNWHSLLAELGDDFNEKLLLEAAMRLRRSVGDNDMVARIAGGRFAAIAQGLANQKDIGSLATRLVVSGLRIDSPLLNGVELKFRVIVLNLKVSAPLSLAVAQAWLDNLASRFQTWPSSHRSRSILIIEQDDDVIERFEADSNY